MRKTFTTAAFAVVVALALAACGDKAADDTTTGKTDGGASAPAAPALAGGDWMGDKPDMARGVTAISFFKPG